MASERLFRFSRNLGVSGMKDMNNSIMQDGKEHNTASQRHFSVIPK